MAGCESTKALRDTPTSGPEERYPNLGRFVIAPRMPSGAYQAIASRPDVF